MEQFKCINKVNPNDTFKKYANRVDLAILTYPIRKTNPIEN